MSKTDFLDVETLYLWLEVGVQQHVPIWINGKVVSVWADLHRETDGCWFIQTMTSGDFEGTHGETRRELLDVAQAHVDSHDAENQLVLVLA